MTGPERWRRIEELFEGALELPENERDDWLAAACDGDDELREEVRAMLAAHERPGVLDRDAGGLAAAALRDTPGASSLPPRIGPYRVEEEIGRGGMGVVYRAHDERLRRSLVLKLLPPSLHADPSARERFLTEARAASSLEHPAICTVYDLGETEDGRLYIAMAYYPGRTLEDRLARIETEGPVPVAQALDWTVQAAHGLARAHAAGVVHRDVKPANLLLTDEGRVKLLDFGVAKLESAASLTEPGAGPGTPAYMAPEQIRGEPVDGRTDLFSLGAVLYQLVTGTRPFRADTPAVALHGVLYEEPPPVTSLRPEAPRELDRIVARCLAKDPEGRPDSAEELIRELEAVRSGRRRDAGRQGAPPSGLPASLTPFVGREREVGQVVEALRTNRLLTLTGPGGTGKTRLALEAARRLVDETAGELADGVHFVPLDPVREPSGVAPALGAALGLPETAARTPAEALQAFLRDRRCLLVLDNFEQVVEAAPLLAELLARCPGLRMVVTSRVLLRVTGERVFPVPPLALPGAGAPATAAGLERHAATALFLDRARAADPGFVLRDEEAPAVAELCRRLDGLPLAIELAAARVRHFDPRTLLERLGGRLDLLGTGPRDAPERHQTLRQAIAWSLDLLDPAERALFRRLAVFVGGITPEAAEAVARAADEDPRDVLESLSILLDHSLIQRIPVPEGTGPGRRYRMLETVRELAFERLRESGEEEAVRGAHCAFFLALAERAEEHLTGAEQLRWLERLVVHQEDFRTALRHAEARGDAETALRLAAALWRFWLIRGRLREGRDGLDRAVRLAVTRQRKTRRVHRAHLARALHGLGILLNNLGENDEAFRVLEESLALFRELEDRRGLADQLNNLAWVALEVSENERAKELSEEALRLHRELGDVRGEALALNNLGWVAIYEADYALGRDYLTRSLALRRRIGDPRGVAFALSILAWSEARTGRFEEATERLREAEELLQRVDDRMLPGLTLNVLGLVARERGEAAQAVEILERSRETWTEAGNLSGLALTLAVLAPALAALGRPEEAQEAATEARELADRIASPWLAAEASQAAARAALARGEVEEATSRAREALATFRRVNDRRGVAEALETLAAGVALEGDAERGGRLLGAARALREAIGVPPPVGSVLEAPLRAAAMASGAVHAGRGLSLEEACRLASED